MAKLAYILSCILLAGMALAQEYGPMPSPTAPLPPIPYVAVAIDSVSNTINDSTSIAATADTTATDTTPKARAYYIFNDSILNSISPAQLVYTAEYIELPPPVVHIRPVVDEADIKPLNRKRHPSWLFTILTLQFILIVYLRVAFIRYAEEQYRSFFNLNISQQVFREQELSMPFPALLLSINGILSYSVLLYLSLDYLDILNWLTPGTLFLACLGMVFGTASLKYILMWFTAAIFPFRDELNFYNFNFFLNIKVLGAILLPINFVVAYAPQELTEWTIIGAASVMAIAYLGLAVKGLAIAKNYLAFHKFHFIVYFCSLEIAPVLVFAKLILNAAK